MSQPLFYYDTGNFQGGINTPLTTSWIYLAFLFPTKVQITIAPEYSNTDVIYFSKDGVNIEGRLNPQDAMLNLPCKRRTGIWLMANSGNQNARVWAY